MVRIATINFNGMFYKNRFQECIAWLQDLDLDIILLQETHLNHFDCGRFSKVCEDSEDSDQGEECEQEDGEGEKQNRVEKDEQEEDGETTDLESNNVQHYVNNDTYHCFWSPSYPTRNRGTAILLKKSHVFHIVDTSTPMHGRSTMVRYLDHDMVSWEIWSIYGPYRSGERSKFYKWLPIHPYKAKHMIVGGDIGLFDKAQIRTDTKRQKITRTRVCKHLKELVSRLDLFDAWRECHDAPGYTWNDEVRLDKIFLPRKMQAKYTLETWLHDCELSDHKCVVADVNKCDDAAASCSRAKSRKLNGLIYPWID